MSTYIFESQVYLTGCASIFTEINKINCQGAAAQAVKTISTSLS